MSHRNARKIPARKEKRVLKQSVQAPVPPAQSMPSWLPTDSADFVAWGRAAERAYREYKLAFDGPQRHRSDPKALREMEDARQLMRHTLERVVPVGFWEGLADMVPGKSYDMEVYIAFLEADLYFMCSGYAKATIIRYLKWLTLSRAQQRRLQEVVLRVLDKGFRREFRSYCHLARHVQSADWLPAIEARLASSDPNLVLRAKWLLEACRRV
jgi:hypothetical protein